MAPPDTIQVLAQKGLTLVGVPADRSKEYIFIRDEPFEHVDTAFEVSAGSAAELTTVCVRLFSRFHECEDVRIIMDDPYYVGGQHSESDWASAFERVVEVQDATALKARLARRLATIAGIVDELIP